MPMLDPELKALLDQCKAAIEQGSTLRDQLNEIIAWGAENGRITASEKAIRQLETDHLEMVKTIETKLQLALRQAYDTRGEYRGVFPSEQQSRAFGLFVLARTMGADGRRFADAYDREFGQIYPRAMATDPDSSGGALIPPAFSARIQRLIEEYGVFERNAFIMPMSSDSLAFIAQTGEVTVYLVGENAAGTASDPTVANVILTAKEWGTLTYYPRSLGEDAAVAVGELVARSVAYAMAKKMDDVGFAGTGSSTDLLISGVKKRLTDVNGVDNGGGLVLGAGNLFSELTLANHESVAAILPMYADAQAQWYCSRPYYFNVMVRLELAAGGVTAGEIEGRRRPLFLGMPVQITQSMPRTDANSQVACILGDLRQAATVGRRRGLAVEESREYKFAERQVTVLGTQRVAVNVHDVGDATNAGPVAGLITAAS